MFFKYATLTLGIPTNQVHLLEDATLGELMHELDWLASVSKAYNGTAKIILYYAGHGIPDESTKDAFILPVDGYSSNTKTAIKLQDIYTQITEYPTKSVYVFLDACFSGASRDGMLASGRGVRIKPKEQLIKDNMIVFTAVSNDETAHPYTEKQHGLFTYFLLKKLQETKGELTLGQLNDYLKENVLKKSVVLQREQNPTVKTNLAIGEGWKNWNIK